MTRRLALFALVGPVALALAACSAVLGFSDRSGTWCSSAQHAFCDDFDDSAFAAKWASFSTDAGTFGPTDSDASSPHALLAEATPVTEGTGGAGLSLAFPHRSSASSMCLAFDMQVLTLEFGDAGPDAAAPPPTPANPGLLSSVGMAALTLANTVTRESATIAITLQAQFGAGQPAMLHPLRDSPDVPGSMTLGGPPVDVEVWNHVELQLKPPTLFVQFGGQTARMDLPDGIAVTYPGVLLGVETFPPMGNVKMRFDNVTVDFDCVD